MIEKLTTVSEMKITDFITVIFTYICFVGIYFFGSSFVSLGICVIISILSLHREYVPLIFMGASNYLPTLYGVSPIFICMFIMLMVLLKEYFIKKRFVIYKMKSVPWIIFLIMIGWSAITGLSYYDFSFFSQMITSIIFMVMIFLYVTNSNQSIENLLKYFIIGIGIGILFTFFIQFNILGFYSYHPFRLAVGERADPNSSGLLFAVLCTYEFICIFENLRGQVVSTLMYLIFFVLGLYCLFLTQSRGSLLCLVICVFLYITMPKSNTIKVNIKTIRNIVIVLLIIGVVLIFNRSIIDTLFDSWNGFFERISAAESNDGERTYLLHMSFKSFIENPVIGISLQSFKSYAGHIPHNTFSDYMVTNGIIGVVFYILFFIKPLFSIFKYWKYNLFIKPYFTYLVCSMNVLFYSASNEKVTLFLLMILFLNITIINKIYIKKEKSYVKNIITRSNRL